MAQDSTRSSRRLVQLTPSADKDRFAIYVYNEQQRGAMQAANYDDFLQTIMRQLADMPTLAPLVPDRLGTRVFVARWKRARDGHRIFYRETDEGILVLHILHSAMNWPDHLGDE